MDPHKQFSEKNHTLLQQVYEGLVRFDADGKIEPGLAESWERKDPLRMRFKLRKGVRFHDGEPFDSKAVVFTISRYLAPETRFPAYGFINSIEKAEAVDEHTVDIITKYPDGLLLNRLAGFILIMAPDFIAKNGEQALQSRSAGTGPFILDRWEKEKAVVLKKNPDYWNTGYPKIDELRFIFLPAKDQMAALLQGKVDLITEMPGTYTQQAKAHPGTDVLKQETLYAVVGAFNTSRPPLTDKRVRQALAHAINKELFIRYDLMGNGRVLAGLAMPGEIGYDPGLQPYTYSPKKAASLLRQAGVPKGAKLKAFIQAQSERTARILASQLKDVGIDLQIEQITPDADVIAKIRQGDWDMTVAGLPNPMAHSFFIPTTLLSSQSPFSIHKDPAFDERLKQITTELDPNQAAVLAKKLDRFIQEEALCLFSFQKIRTYGISKKVHFTPSRTGMPYFYSAYISE